MGCPKLTYHNEFLSVWRRGGHGKNASENFLALAEKKGSAESCDNYYPFGLEMKARTWSDTTLAYRYGFNGKEKDSAFASTVDYDYGFRIYSPNIAKFLSVDPLARKFAELTPYQFGSNMPIAAIDIDGLEAKLAIYGAGVARDASGSIIERHEAQFKKEADRDVKQENATVSLGIHKGNDLVQTLKGYTLSEGSIEYLSISSHASSMGVILDNGEYGKEVIGRSGIAWSGYTAMDIKNISKNNEIKFASNALVIFTGCNTGRTSDQKTGEPIYSVAIEFTKASGVATIGAVGYTAPSGKDGNRKSDYEYRLFYKDENNVLHQRSLGKELTQEKIDIAKQVINDVVKKIEEKKVEQNKNSNDSTKKD